MICICQKQDALTQAHIYTNIISLREKGNYTNICFINARVHLNIVFW